MLLQEKMAGYPFSPSEKVVVDFILNKQEQIEYYSTKTIAAETFTSPSILVRIAQKLDFEGWLEFKQAFLGEVQYLGRNFIDIDANFPFSANDSLMTIASKITKVKAESLEDTLALLNHDLIRQAVRMMEKAENIKLFGIYNVLFLGEEFVHKLKHINKRAEISMTQNAIYQEAEMMTPKGCAICISYSGETGEILNIAKTLKEKGVPVIALTSIGENTLSNYADVTLRISTRERSYSKIAGFSSLESISLILDILYASYFAIHYEKNYAYKVSLSKKTEQREIDNRIIRE